MLKHYILGRFALDDLWPHLFTFTITSRLGNRQKTERRMSLGNLSIVAFHVAKVPKMTVF